MKKIIFIFLVNAVTFILFPFLVVLFLLMHGTVLSFLLFGLMNVTDHRSLNLNDQFSIYDCNIEKDGVLFYQRTDSKKKENRSLYEGFYHSGEVTKLYKVNDIWLGFIGDEEKRKIGYFILSENSRFRNLSEADFNEKLEELPINDRIKNKIINKKIKFKNPYYYLVRYGVEIEECYFERSIHRGIFNLTY